ncbi:hypothetical protein Q3G72_016057 [Acer saccharum]|nr:hypothetical protein Q3G72_016057 [Acer saccharum]
MALQSLSSLHALLPSHVVVGSSFGNGFVHFRAQRHNMAATKMSHQDHQIITRRAANFKPPIWSYNYIQSLSSEFAGKTYAKKLKSQELKEDVRAMLVKVKDPLHQMELIDTLQRLGLSYHFDHEIKLILGAIYDKRSSSSKPTQESLYAVALEFRFLTQHGFDTSQEGESIFHSAINFTTAYLKEYVKHSKDDEYLSTLANHALELPLHCRMLRLEARWFIDVYEKHHPDMNPVLLELAKLDFNVVQATHQEDLKHTSTGGQGRVCRRMSTKVHALITTIDDVYDVYGSLGELELFTDAVERLVVAR